MLKQWQRRLKNAGLRYRKFHDLRHTFATQCIESGIDVKALSEILGHSSVKITMDKYVHLTMRFKHNQITILQFPEKNRIF